jgi:hypothetical protein
LAVFVFQWDDELMSRESGIALFDAIGSAEKTLQVNPGGHVAMPLFERDAAEAFVHRHLLTSCVSRSASPCRAVRRGRR